MKGMDFLANMAKRVVQNREKHSHSYGLSGFGQRLKPDLSENPFRFKTYK